ncbi:MAG: chemotaxis response regulator protein-glutamate methylesterase [Planctomycetota bacterium]
MAAGEIRVLVVDDSAVIRSLIADSITATPGMMVAGTAEDGQKALEILDAVRPDVITLDVQMPRMDGLATLDAILLRHSIPVIMVSSLTKLGAEIALDALDRGAVDYLAKPDYGEQTRTALRDELPRKIRMAAGCDVQRILEIRRGQKLRIAQRVAQRGANPAGTKPSGGGLADGKVVSSYLPPELAGKCVAIGISTGGPPALAQLFAAIRPPMPPIIVVQHMPPSFTKPLAWRLDSLGELSVKEAASGDVLQPNCVLIAPGGKHLQVRRVGNAVRAVVTDGQVVSGHKPSVDVMMKSVAEAFGSSCLGVIMTGMGRDGADGCRAIRAAGGYVLGQDDATSDVYGMNKVAFVEGNVDRQFALNDAAAFIAHHVRKLRATALV